MTKLTPQKMHDAHKELQEIFVKKNTDYGNSFEESLEKHGLIAAIVRMEDKMSRLQTLSKQAALVKDESIIDTLKDLSNYALMSAVWLEQSDAKPVKTPVNYTPTILTEERQFQSPEFIEFISALDKLYKETVFSHNHWLVNTQVSNFQDDTVDIAVTDTNKAYDFVKSFFKDKDKTFVFEHLPHKDRNAIVKSVRVTVIDRIEPIPLPKPKLAPKIFKSDTTHPYTATFGVDDHGRPIVVKHHEHDDV
jgi:hypothetical protein|nr:MAG TPA: Nucleotide modification associated domain 1 [Caudoviricetes sp.]